MPIFGTVSALQGCAYRAKNNTEGLSYRECRGFCQYRSDTEEVWDFIMTGSVFILLSCAMLTGAGGAAVVGSGAAGGAATAATGAAAAAIQAVASIGAA